MGGRLVWRDGASGLLGLGLLAGALIESDRNVKGGQGIRRARELLESGAALRAMEQIIEAQGPASQTLEPGTQCHEVTAPRAGTVEAIDCLRIARVARVAGAPAFKGAGVDLLKKAGDTVRKGEPLYRIHAGLKADLDFAAELAGQDNGYLVDGIVEPA